MGCADGNPTVTILCGTVTLDDSLRHQVNEAPPVIITGDGGLRRQNRLLAVRAEHFVSSARGTLLRWMNSFSCAAPRHTPNFRLKSARLADSEGLFQRIHLDSAPGVSGLDQCSPIPE